MEREINILRKALRKIIYFLLGIDTAKVQADYRLLEEVRPAHKVRRHHFPRTHSSSPYIMSEVAPLTVHYIHSYGNKTIKNAIWRMKFNGDNDCLQLFSQQLGSQIFSYINKTNTGKILIMPTPTTEKRLRARGSWITQGLSKNTCAHLNSLKDIALENNPTGSRKSTSVHFITDTVSICRHESPRQSHHPTRTARINAMHTIFYTKKPENIKDAHIICIDDVCTTGATLADIRRVCVEAGCASFTAWVIAD
jgi:predicted amidophosphoribosyltransferase